MILASQVRNYCDCATNDISCFTYQPIDVSAENSTNIGNNEVCLLANLERTLTRLKLRLRGRRVTCRRSSSADKQTLLYFNQIIQEYYGDITPLEIFGNDSVIKLQNY